MKMNETEIYLKEIKPRIDDILEIRGDLEWLKKYPDAEITYSNELKLKSIEGLSREIRLIMKNYGWTRRDLIRISNKVNKCQTLK